MPYKNSGILMSVQVVFIIACCSILPLFAQDDPDPNSPAPVILGINSPTKTVAPKTRLSLKSDIYRVEPMAFEPGSNVELLISSVPLMKDEDFTAFRVYAQSSKGRLYRFPATALRMSDFNKEVYVLSITLQDEFGFWELPAATSDLLIQVTWRGMASNTLRLGS